MAKFEKFDAGNQIRGLAEAAAILPPKTIE